MKLVLAVAVACLVVMPAAGVQAIPLSGSSSKADVALAGRACVPAHSEFKTGTYRVECSQYQHPPGRAEVCVAWHIECIAKPTPPGH